MIPGYISTIYMPTSPSLPIKTLKMTEIKKIGENKVVASFANLHTNDRHVKEFEVSLSRGKCFNAKGLQLIRILNEIMREGGCDYNIIYPNMVQVDHDLEFLQVDKEAKMINQLTGSSKEFEDFVSSDKFTNEEKKHNFSQSVTAYCIFSYIFGGFVHDSSKLQNFDFFEIFSVKKIGKF